MFRKYIGRLNYIIILTSLQNTFDNFFVIMNFNRYIYRYRQTRYNTTAANWKRANLLCICNLSLIPTNITNVKVCLCPILILIKFCTEIRAFIVKKGVEIGLTGGRRSRKMKFVCLLSQFIEKINAG